MLNRIASVARKTPANTASHRLRGIFFKGRMPILASAVLWGTAGIASSLAPTDASMAAIGCAGLAIGGTLLFLTSRAARSLPVTCAAGERRFLVMGALAVAGYPLTFYASVARTGVAAATVVALGSAPVFSGLLSWITGKSRPTAHWTAAATAAVLGCSLLILGPSFKAQATPIDLSGVMLAAGAGLSYSVYSLICGKFIVAGYRSDAVMGVMFGAAAILVLPVSLLSDNDWITTLRGVAVAAYIAFFTVYLAYRLFGFGLRYTTPSTATVLTLAEPAVATALSIAILDEHLSFGSWCGLAILIVGLLLLSSTKNADSTTADP
ncbi:DMT family transporter [Streptomyces sp. NPDC088748]|uniref:DMT family transporter n=1 Tax=Streptomyces sp. NPDC088748 TaxID=3365887 RepID=UPI003810F0EA